MMFISALPARARAAAAVVLGVGVVLEILHLLHNGLKIGVPRYDEVVSTWVHMGVLVAAVLLLVIRVVSVREERLAWSVLLIGMLNWTIASALWKWDYSLRTPPPFPSICDWLWLTLYPASYMHLVLLVRSRVQTFHRSVWFDGVIGALGMASLAATVVFQRVLDATGGSAAAIATNLSYPIGDFLQLAFITAVFALTGWRPGKAFGWLGFGMACMAIADSTFLMKVADGSWVDGSAFTDAVWTLGMLAMACSALLPSKTINQIRLDAVRMLVIPAAFTLLAVAVLGAGLLNGHNRLGGALALATVVVVALRGWLQLRDSARITVRSQRESNTDPLTGLANRRAFEDAAANLVTAEVNSAPSQLVLMDLDGFKQYNDTYGHIAGDRLLQRLGELLRDVSDQRGDAYRLGGDEFCLVLDATTSVEELAADIVDGLDGVLAEHPEVNGGNESIGVSYGRVELPREAASIAAALHLADQRMYEHKSSRRIRRGSPAGPAPVVILDEFLDRHHRPRSLSAAQLEELRQLLSHGSS